MIKILILVLFGLPAICIGQNPKNSNGIRKYRQMQIDSLVDLVKNDKIKELSSKVVYPIKRPNPIPDIKTQEQFILYYPVLFDSIFKKEFCSTQYDSSNTIDRYDGFMAGGIWINDEGWIISIHKHSPMEDELAKKLKLETESEIHSSVNKWNQNILLCRTEKHLIRVDQMENNELRLIVWNKPKPISEVPDLVIVGGTLKLKGSRGGEYLTFKKGELTYQIDRELFGESDIGLFLRIFKNDVEKVRLRAKELK